MKIGVTGTREGATEYQLGEIRKILKGTKFHHNNPINIICPGEII